MYRICYCKRKPNSAVQWDWCNVYGDTKEENESNCGVGAVFVLLYDSTNIHVCDCRKFWEQYLPNVNQMIVIWPVFIANISKPFGALMVMLLCFDFSWILQRVGLTPLFVSSMSGLCKKFPKVFEFVKKRPCGLKRATTVYYSCILQWVVLLQETFYKVDYFMTFLWCDLAVYVIILHCTLLFC
jgi:hypothetical protein